MAAHSVNQARSRANRPLEFLAPKISTSKAGLELLIRTVFVGLCFMLSAMHLSHAQQLRVVGYDPVQGPICAGPLGPGPCARVQQYIITHHLADQPSGAPSQTPAINPGTPVIPFPSAASGQLNGTAQQVAINCAQRTGTDVRGFVACAQGNLILPQREQAVLDCAVSSQTKQAFAECAAPNLGITLTDDQRKVAGCAVQSGGDKQDFLSCAGSALIRARLTAEQNGILNCATDANGDASTFASCSASQIVGSRLTREQRIAVECAAQSEGDNTDIATQFATCAGTKFLNLNLNPEQRIAVECVVETGGQPYAAAGCMATRLTARELEKCAQYGFGGDRGCFGNNNDLFGRNGWTARTFAQIAGGPNSVVRNPAQIFGGPNSVFNNPGQLSGGPNSVVNNLGQILGGPNSVFNNPGQLIPKF